MIYLNRLLLCLGAVTSSLSVIGQQKTNADRFRAIVEIADNLFEKGDPKYTFRAYLLYDWYEDFRMMDPEKFSSHGLPVREVARDYAFTRITQPSFILLPDNLYTSDQIFIAEVLEKDKRPDECYEGTFVQPYFYPSFSDPLIPQTDKPRWIGSGGSFLFPKYGLDEPIILSPPLRNTLPDPIEVMGINSPAKLGLGSYIAPSLIEIPSSQILKYNEDTDNSNLTYNMYWMWNLNNHVNLMSYTYSGFGVGYISGSLFETAGLKESNSNQVFKSSEIDELLTNEFSFLTEKESGGKVLSTRIEEFLSKEEIQDKKLQKQLQKSLMLLKEMEK